jgi:hypothetical protein
MLAYMSNLKKTSLLLTFSTLTMKNSRLQVMQTFLKSFCMQVIVYMSPHTISFKVKV